MSRSRLSIGTTSPTTPFLRLPLSDGTSGDGFAFPAASSRSLSVGPDLRGSPSIGRRIRARCGRSATGRSTSLSAASPQREPSASSASASAAPSSEGGAVRGESIRMTPVPSSSAPAAESAAGGVAAAAAGLSGVAAGRLCSSACDRNMARCGCDHSPADAPPKRMAASRSRTASESGEHALRSTSCSGGVEAASSSWPSVGSGSCEITPTAVLSSCVALSSSSFCWRTSRSSASGSTPAWWPDASVARAWDGP